MARPASPAVTDDGGLPPVRAARSALRLALAGAVVGNTFVWFDFALFGTVSALVFPKLFFPALSPFAGQLATFLTFGVGLLARPVGALYFANAGDRLGRTKMLVLTLVLMSSASVGIGLLPGYPTIGVAAPILLVLLRLAQGFSLGGESSAAAVLALEYASPGRRGLTVATVVVGAPLGQVLVSLALVIVRGIAGESVFLAWAWRIPFMLGFGLAVIGYLIRRKVEETPVFRRAMARAAARVRTPIMALLRGYPKMVALLIALAIAPAALNYVCSVFALGYFKDQLHLPTQVGFTLLLATNLAGMFLNLLGGGLSDRYGRKPVMYAMMGVALVGSLLYFPLVGTRSWPVMLLASLLTLGALATAGGARGPLFAEPFPTTVRYSGHAAATTIGNVVGGSPAPFLAAALLQWTGTPWSIAVALALLFALSLGVLPFIRETVDVNLETTGETAPGNRR
jgi:MFS family permease